MDRDRDWRVRDIPPEDRFGTGGGQSYRPSAAGRDRSPPPRRSPIPSRVDSYRSRDRSPLPRVDSYTPAGRAPPLRPRSRSPPLRGDTYRRRSPTPPRYRDAGGRPGGDSYRARPRSPLPPRRDLPRDDLFRREPPRPPPRDFRYRDRSPLPLKRGRDPSPVQSRGRRTPPPPLKRDRLVSPPLRSRYDNYPPSRGISPPTRGYSPHPPRGPIREYRVRSRSPMTRSDRMDSRPASPRPQKYTRDLYDDDNGRVSVSTSRRSSPPVHPSRLPLQGAALDDRRPLPRDVYPDERPPYRARSPPPRRPSPEPSRDHEMRDHDRSNTGIENRISTPREPAIARAPPSGPSGSQYAPPTGPAASQASTPASLQPRTPAVPPSGPRGDTSSRGGYASRGRGGYGTDFAPRGRGAGYGGFRGGRGGAPIPYVRGGSYDQREAEFSAPSGPSAGGAANPPSGPRASLSQPHQQAPPPSRPPTNQPASSFQRLQRFPSNNVPSSEPPTGPKASTMPPFPRRSTQQSPQTGPAPLQSPANNNLALPSSSIPTGPSADRRTSAPPIHPALQDLPKIVEGGQRLEPLTDRTRLGKLEEESERLRRQIEEKEVRKRKAVREWDRLQREAETAALRSELAENSVRNITGEEESMAAF